MARKPLEDPPAASSSEDDGVEISSDEGEEEISASSSEENKPKDPSTKQSSDSDPESEADSEPEAQLSSKATTVSALKSKNKESKDTPAVKSGKKRAGEGTSTENAKKAKIGEENKKSLFQRLWTEDDEISLLQGMIDYKADTGKSPYDDMNGFFEFVKKAISFEVSKIQFGDKIRSLKRKYLGKSKKGKETKGHDKECLKLATHIWGSDGLGLESAVKSSVRSKKKVDSVVESAAVKSHVPSKKKVDSSAVKSPVQSKKKVDSMVEPSAVKSPKKNENEKKKMDSMVEDDKEMLGSDGKVSNVESLEPEGEKVEEDKEVLTHGGPSWFEESFLVGSIMSFGVDEQSVKKRWSKVPVETQKTIEEKLKIVQAKEFELLMLKTEIMRDAGAVLYEAI